MEIKRGIAVSPGVAIGPALVLDTEGVRIPRRFIEKKLRKQEVDRLQAALVAAEADALEQQDAISQKVGKQYGAIFAGHAFLIKDPELRKEFESSIRDQNYSAE